MLLERKSEYGPCVENPGEIQCLCRSKLVLILVGASDLNCTAPLPYLSHMPYEISFTKAVDVQDPSIYINQCCWGGDVVRDRLLPLIKEKFEDIRTAQEDWGWFIWFQRGNIRLAIDIFSDDREGRFRLRLSSQRKRFLIRDLVIDTFELEKVRELVMTNLTNWASDTTLERVS